MERAAQFKASGIAPGELAEVVQRELKENGDEGRDRQSVVVAVGSVI